MVLLITLLSMGTQEALLSVCVCMCTECTGLALHTVSGRTELRLTLPSR